MQETAKFEERLSRRANLWTEGALVFQKRLDAFHHAIDFAQRSILFWDTIRRRGNGLLEAAQRGGR
jgi:hypothetical protein